MPQGTLEVELVKAHGLQDVEFFGKSDPYAVLTCGPVQHKSKTISDGGGDSTWNQSFLFEIPHGPTELSIALFDFEKHGTDEAMGTVNISLAEIFAKRELPPTCYKVQLPNGKLEGELEVGLKFFPKVHNGTLAVHLQEAHGLLDTDVFGKAQPYAHLMCQKQSHKSCVLEGTNPVWNEQFDFDIDSDVTDLLIRLFDKDTFSDDPLGSVTIPLFQVFCDGHVSSTKYKILGKLGQPQGEISVAMKFIPKN